MRPSAAEHATCGVNPSRRNAASLGYAFYSVLYATAGSLVSRQEETQSLQLPMAGLLFVAYILAFVATESPDGAAALIGSLFPPRLRW
jgi:ABC-2 type transport system permease protein